MPRPNKVKHVIVNFPKIHNHPFAQALVSTTASSNRPLLMIAKKKKVTLIHSELCTQHVKGIISNRHH